MTHWRLYKLYPSSLFTGTKKYDIYHPASQLEIANTNIFRSLFGISFEVYDTKQSFWSISRFEYNRCFGFSSAYNKSVCPQISNIDVLLGGCPEHTMHCTLNKWFISLILHRKQMMMSNDLTPRTPVAKIFNVMNAPTIIKICSPEA